MRANWGREGAILFAVFLDMVGFTMLIPDVQFRAEELHIVGWMIGAMLVSTFVVQTIASPLWSGLADRVGRKRIFLICTIFSALGMGLYAIANSLELMFLCRIMAGLGSANVAIASAMMSSGSAPENRAATMGRFSAAMSVGLVIGPAIGGVAVDDLGRWWLGVIAAGLSMLGFSWVLLSVPNDLGDPQPEAKTRRPFRLMLLREYPNLRVLVVVAFVAWFALALLEGTFGRLIKANLGLKQEHFGLIFAYESAIAVIFQTFLIGKISKSFGAGKVLIVCYLLQGLGLIIFPFAPSLVILFVGSTFFGIGSALATPTINTIASLIIPEKRHGELFGLFQGWRGFGFVVGPMIGGLLFDFHHAAPYQVAAIVCVAGAIALMLSPASLQRASSEAAGNPHNMGNV
ncbi:MAG: MFS transporter [Armatimonadetes bacterium]|nr:MFS transporter [Armatimonadota bacterium]